MGVGDQAITYMLHKKASCVYFCSPLSLPSTSTELNKYLKDRWMIDGEK